MPAFPDHLAVIDDGDPERPFRLVPAPSRSFLNTSFNNTPSSIAREGRPTALVHPEALAALGMRDGDRIRIGNGKGSVVVHARAFDGMQKRVVIVEGLWPNHAFAEGIGINLLDQRRPRPARRRRGVPRHLGMAAACVEARWNAGGHGGCRNPPCDVPDENRRVLAFAGTATGYRLLRELGLISC